MAEYLNIGQIVSTHGVRGEVKVYPLTDNISRFSKLKSIYIEKNDLIEQYEIMGVKYLNTMVVIKLNSIDTVDEAEKLRNKYIKINREDAVKLPKDSYFICDLIGLKVYDMNSTFLGTVKDIMKTGSSDIYIVEKDKKEILIPGLKSIFKEINMKDGKIIVDLPEGLVE